MSTEGFRRDLTFAVRTLRREPAFGAGVVLTFALAIGATAAMFGLVVRLMLAPPPGIRDAERVARVQLRIGDGQGALLAGTTSYPAFRSLRAVSNAFASVGATSPDSVTVGRSPDVTQVAGLGTSGEYFQTVAVPPALGRYIGPADDQLPAGSSVAVLGHAYWQRVYGGDRAVLGREIVIDEHPFAIVGVAPAGFNGDGLAPVDLFIPLTAAMRKRPPDWSANGFANIVSIVVRVRDGVTPDVARQIASAALRDGSSAAGKSRTPSVELEPVIPGKASRESPQAQIAIWLAAVSVIVLLIATANVGTLLSLRSAKRRRETAVRIALGAGNADLARQLLIESGLLALLGAVVGLLLSRSFSQIMRVTLLPTLASTEAFVDRRVLVVSVVVACVAGLIAGLAPLSQARRTDLATQLRAGGEHGASSRLAFQNTLVSIQVALCTLLLVGAALFVRSLARVESQDLGLSTENVLYVTLEARGYLSGVERDMAYYDALRSVRGVAGVTGATAAAGIPFGPHNIPPVSVPGLPWPPVGQLPIMYAATPDYLDIMGVKLVQGRLFDGRDTRGSAPVVLINETMARTVWPNESALGRCVRVGFATFPPIDEGNPAERAPCRTVVGVVRDSRARSIRPERNEDRLMQYYVVFDQMPPTPFPNQPQVMGLLVRAHGDLEHTSALVQRTIQSTSQVRLFAHTRPYQDLIDPQLRSWRLGATLFSAFGALALAIAAVGLFGVVSYVVTQRTREMGVRLALGGTAHSVATLIVRDALRMVSMGVAIGVVAALAAGPLVASMLFQTSPRDPASIAVASLVLLTAAVIAAAWPAWRAGRVNPVVALRADG